MNFDRLSSALALIVSFAVVAGCGSASTPAQNAPNDDAALADETDAPNTLATSDAGGADASMDAMADAMADATADAMADSTADAMTDVAADPSPDATAADGPTVSPDAPPASWFAGSTCTYDRDCAAGFLCEGWSLSPAVTGLCVRKLPSCVPYPCAAGMNCYDELLAPNTHLYSFCAPVPTLGEICRFMSCRDGYVCVDRSGGVDTVPTCVQGTPLGAACPGDTPCAGGESCEQTSIGATTYTCQAQVGLGEHCLNTSDCGGYDVWCDKSYRCAIRGGDGAPCTPSGIYAYDPQCAPHYTCDPGTSTCTPIPPAKL